MKNYLISKKYNNWCKRSRKRCSFYQTRINVTICNSNELEELKSKKMLTKQRIKLKTKNNERVLDIPDYLFEVILEERKKYEKNENDQNDGIYKVDSSLALSSWHDGLSAGCTAFPYRGGAMQ